MSHPNWRLVRVLLTCAAVAIVPTLLFSSATSAKTTKPTVSSATLAKPAARDETECEKPRKWAKPYTGKSVTLEEMASFDRAHRIAIFNVLSYEVRAQLWREHLQKFSQRPDLSDAQRALIAEAISLTTPAFYKFSEHNKEPNQSSKKFWERAKPQFTSPEHKRPWLDLGSVVEGSVAAAAIPVNNTKTTKVGKDGKAATEYCFCNAQLSNDCGDGWDCFVGGGLCQSFPTGCGWDGGWACNGYCVERT